MRVNSEATALPVSGGKATFVRGYAMYKDDLQAAQARAEAAEQRARQLARLLEESQSVRWKRIILVPFKWMWGNKGSILAIFGILALLLFIGTCIVAVTNEDRRIEKVKECLVLHCHKICKKDLEGFLTSRVERIRQYSGSYYTCTCYLEQSKRTFNFSIPDACSRFLK